MKEEKLVRALDGQLFAFEHSVVICDPTRGDGIQSLAITASLRRKGGDSDLVESYSIRLIPEVLAAAEDGVDAIKKNAEAEVRRCKTSLLAVAGVLPYQGCLAFSRVFYTLRSTRYSDRSLEVLIERILALRTPPSWSSKKTFWQSYFDSLTAEDDEGKCEAFTYLFTGLSDAADSREAMSLRELKSRSASAKKLLEDFGKHLPGSFLGQLPLAKLVNVVNEEQGVNRPFRGGDIVNVTFSELLAILIGRLDRNLELYESFSGPPCFGAYSLSLGSKKIERNKLQDEIRNYESCIECDELWERDLSEIESKIIVLQTRKDELDRDIKSLFDPPLDEGGYRRLSPLDDFYYSRPTWRQETAIDEILMGHFLYFTGQKRPALTAGILSVMFPNDVRSPENISKARAERNASKNKHK